MVARDKEDLSGQQFGNYAIVSHVSARDVSDLFLARDVKLERLIFLEVLRVTEKEDKNLADRFRGRMETVSQLKDPHIGVVSDVDVTEDGYPYAVIEYFPGISLAEKISNLNQAQITLPVTESLELVKQITQGLGVAHAADLIHHDLRPENIMLREDGTPVLIDLGVPVVPKSGKVGLSGPDNNLLDYASPEELAAKPVNSRSNIYSLGIILYELLAGHRPRLPILPYDIFPQANMPKEEPLEDARPGLAGETYRLVRNSLWRQEWSRFETADEMITAIETAIFAEQELPKAAVRVARGINPLALIIPIALILVGIASFMLLRGFIENNNVEAAEATTIVQTTSEATVAGGVNSLESEPTQAATETATIEFPTESATIFSISVLSPGPNRTFSVEDTINFDWFWPTLPEPGRNFGVYLIEETREYLLGSLTEPNNGAAYRLSIPASQIPVTGENLAWQVRLEQIDGGDVIVASDEIPIAILDVPTPTMSATALATATSTPTATASSTPTLTPSPTATLSLVGCVVSPPFGWILYTIQPGDSLFQLALNADMPVEELLLVNCLPNALLSIGQQIWVPRTSLSATPTAASPATSIPFPTDEPPPTSRPPTSVPPTSVPPTSVPPTSVPPTSVPPTEPPVEPSKTPPIPPTPTP